MRNISKNELRIINGGNEKDPITFQSVLDEALNVIKAGGEIVRGWGHTIGCLIWGEK